MIVKIKGLHRLELLYSQILSGGYRIFERKTKTIICAQKCMLCKYLLKCYRLNLAPINKKATNLLTEIKSKKPKQQTIIKTDR